MENDAVKLHEELTALIKRMVAGLGAKRTLSMIRSIAGLYKVEKRKE